jgi:hypothetical protein
VAQRRIPLVKQLALMLVAKSPGPTTDWLFLGRTGGSLECLSAWKA